ncbi:hypothetical protein NOF04DRAFT_20582 [Fusarium oxysporum II5]|uniref:Metalloendopeptidase n=1 Tax=Fusarium odoratissimum (strain NRRL 54006) TaxID=1089451 RepID=X0INJ3_FUSO5|nr:uncharacterized protein FOIG_16275 [Fusarium odoratissimum NRRL 54006]EXL90483.1 hypothetical protein FOIG_16275 [Fusarium odoratissimum NRRL 54006]KAK2124348.1 hypothetical protein NOF04DRAFT_20582 [Fusarium oxysporum II5]
MPALADPVKLWKNRCVPYVDNISFMPPHTKKVREVLDEWEKACGISFVPRRFEDNYVIIQPGDGQTAIGMQGGPQEVFFPDPMDSMAYFTGKRRGRALHELGHTLGLINEQCRSDRDSFVNFEWKNIANGESNDDFKVRQSHNLTEYDRDSVMNDPDPNEGWSSMANRNVARTIRWKTDQTFIFSPEKLSELDKKAIKDKYAVETVPMGLEVKLSRWFNPYAVQVPFSIGGRQFIYAQNTGTKDWFTAELKNGDSIVDVQLGRWNNAYRIAVPLNIEGQLYLFAMNTDNNYWFIQRLQDDGKMGTETANGFWKNTYESLCSFSVDGKTYMYGQNRSNNEWFIQELLPGGKMGLQTSNGTHKYSYDMQFPYSVAGRQYLYRYRVEGNYWTIRELLPGGNLSEKFTDGNLDERYHVQFSYSIGNNVYLYGQSSSTMSWSIRRFEGNKVGNMLQRGSWGQYYAVQFPLALPNGRQGFYGNNASGDKWFIQELLNIPV